MTGVDPPPLRLQQRFEATMPNIRTILSIVTDDLRARGAPPVLVDDLNIVLCEVLTNIVRHGYPFRTGWIDYVLVLTPNGVACQISDEGVAYDPHTLGKASPPPQTRAEGGYGWALIHALSDDLHYSRHHGQNELRFVIPTRPALPAVQSR